MPLAQNMMVKQIL